jgi:hypothetical protein
MPRLHQRKFVTQIYQNQMVSVLSTDVNPYRKRAKKADGEGFEPPVPFRVRRFSKPVP